jgi:hypothetical protein
MTFNFQYVKRVQIHPEDLQRADVELAGGEGGFMGIYPSGLTEEQIDEIGLHFLVLRASSLPPTYI